MGISKLYCLKRVLYLRANFRSVFSRLYSDAVQNEAKCPEEKGPPAGGGAVDGNKKGLVLGVFEGKNKFELSSAAEEINQKSDGKLCRHLNELSCQLRLGKAFAVTDLVPEYSVVALSSFGTRDAGFNKLEQLDEAKENIRWGVGAGVRLLQKRGCSSIDVDCATAPEAAAEAAHLAAWRFEEFRTDSSHATTLAPLATSGAGGGADAWAAGALLGGAQNWARYLCDMPSNKMAPVDLAQAALDTLCPLGVRVTVRDRAWLQVQRMEAFLAVASGSCEEPLLLECEYRAADTQPVLLAAEGLTFDSGGLCLKPVERMAEHGSAAGATAVLAVLRVLAELKVPLNVCAVIPLCENMVSGQCMKVGDVVHALNGLSVQIEDTDMEGPLMLADALVYGQSLFKPSLVIDVASFSRSVARLTGGGAVGCFSNSEEAWAAVRRAGACSGDRPWRLPLWDCYSRQLCDEQSVDLRNRGSGPATSCLGAAFLKKFICGDWVHVDVAGTERTARGQPAPPYLRAPRATGRPTRTLAYFLRSVADPKEPDASPSTPAPRTKCD